MMLLFFFIKLMFEFTLNYAMQISNPLNFRDIIILEIWNMIIFYIKVCYSISNLRSTKLN